MQLIKPSHSRFTALGVRATYRIEFGDGSNASFGVDTYATEALWQLVEACQQQPDKAADIMADGPFGRASLDEIVFDKAVYWMEQLAEVKHIEANSIQVAMADAAAQRNRHGLLISPIRKYETGTVTLLTELVPDRWQVSPAQQLHDAMAQLRRKVSELIRGHQWVVLSTENDPAGAFSALAALPSTFGEFNQIADRLGQRLKTKEDRQAREALEAAGEALKVEDEFWV